MSEEKRDEFEYKTCYLCGNYRERYTIDKEKGYINLGYCGRDLEQKPLSRKEKCNIHPCFFPSLQRAFVRDVELQESTGQDEVMRLFIKKYNT